MTVHYRLRTDADDESIAAMWRQINPDRPPATLEEFRHNLKSHPPESGYTLWVAEDRGAIVARAAWFKLVYVAEPGSYFCYVAVLPATRRRGIGRSLSDRGLAALQNLGARRIYTHVREDEPHSLTFARSLGFESTGHGERISRLEVSSANLERCRTAAANLSNFGIRIATLAELGRSDTLLQALHAMDNETSRDIPSSHVHSDVPFDEWLNDSLLRPGARDDAFWMALDGAQPVGMAQLVCRAEHFADNGYTSVRRQYRGRGIARALKLRTVEWAREHCIQAIITGNDPANKPMLAINIDMGYQMLPANIELLKVIEPDEQPEHDQIVAH